MKTKLKILIKTIYFNCLSFVNLSCFYLLFKEGENKKQLALMMNSHLGERCFVVCNGPSLKTEDLDMISENKVYSIGINYISRIYDKTKWRPDLLIRNERGLPSKQHIAVNRIKESALILKNKRDYLTSKFFPGNKVYASIDGNRKYLDTPKFSVDASKILYSVGTSTYLALEMAYHLGFREIYIIGCDMSYAVNLAKDGTIYYNKEGKNYFFEDDNSIPKDIYPNPTWEQIVALDFADKFSRENGFRIYNATRGGCCESFERVDFDSLFLDK